MRVAPYYIILASELAEEAGDVGVVEGSAEALGADPDGEEGYGVAGVFRGGEAVAGDFVLDVEGDESEFGIAGIEVFVGFAVEGYEGAVKGVFEALLLFVGEFGNVEEAEVVGELALHFLPGYGLLGFQEFPAVVAETGFGDVLAVNNLGELIITG